MALATAFALAASCDAGGPENTGSEVIGDAQRAIASACGGPPPTCLTGCRARLHDLDALCVEGAWVCPSGVREDLCCDTALRPEACETWGDSCDPTRLCPDGYTCVQGRDWPIEADLGVCRLGDWRVPPEVARCGEPSPAVWPDALVSYDGPTAVQLEGVVRVTPVCDDRRCDAENPCCQRCMGSYTLEAPRTDGALMALSLRTDSVACAGTNCGFTCTPLQPGRRYRVFGIWLPPSPSGDVAQGVGMMYLVGHCED